MQMRVSPFDSSSRALRERPTVLQGAAHRAANGAHRGLNFAVGCMPRLFPATRRPVAAARLSETREACNVKTSASAMTESETPVDSAADRLSHDAIPVRSVMAIGIGIAAILSLAVSAQTYLSMLGHGHSFRRILLWQLTARSFWGFAAPFVLRWGAEFATRRHRQSRTREPWQSFSPTARRFPSVAPESQSSSPRCSHGSARGSGGREDAVRRGVAETAEFSCA